MKVGELIAGRYELEELVGQGGMSSVYQARDAVLERRVALKVLHEHHSVDAELVERFRREARAIARLGHPNVVTVIDRGEWEGRQYIVFEHVAGEDLKAVIAREGALPVGRALALAVQIARALAFAHGLGIVHRDVKPHNVLVDADGVAKVTDFGIARALDAEDALTQTGTVLGTGHYLSPEQASGARGDERSDQYSLGVVLYELLTGEVPYDGGSLMDIAMRHVRDPVPTLLARRPDAPAGVETVLARALAKQPEERFPSMEAMAAALEDCLAEARSGPGADYATGELPVVPRVPPRRRRPRPSRRRRAIVAALAALLVAGGLLGVALTRDDGLPGVGGLPGGGDNVAGQTPVELAALSDFDPEGGDGEHPEDVPLATDGDAATSWTTESYRSFTKSGVGLVLDAGEPVALGRLVVVTDTPGFTAVIRAGDAPDGPFDDVSDERQAGGRTAFELDTGGEGRRYYLVWITNPNGRAHVSEVRAFAG